MYDKKAFCKGALCRKSDRKYKSFISGKSICGSCSIKIEKDLHCTIDEFIGSDHPIIKLKLLQIIYNTEDEKDIRTDKVPN